MADRAVAIIGMGCRLPGGIRGPAALWSALLAGTDALAAAQPDRGGLLPPGAADAGGPGAGRLDDIDRFDSGLFGLSPREAAVLDPQQRLLLEATWDAVENAGASPATLAGPGTGVWVGLWSQDFETRLTEDLGGLDFHMTTGTGRYAAAGRIAHVFGFGGPALVVDTAASSSLVAVHRACVSLRAGECDVAVAGGANVILSPHVTAAYARAGMLAPDGRCKFGDASADGFVRSEGVGVVVLKPLAAALAAGDPVWAVIRGGAVNNDGGGGDHFVRPDPGGQIEVLRAAWRDAGDDPRTAAYVEAHGTGTPAGDPVELRALGAVVGRPGTEGSPCLVGSVKTGFGHAEAAAGVLGLIKAALVTHHRTVPPSLHHREPAPSVPWEALGLRVPTSTMPLGGGADPRVGVSSFGLAGTNAHLVVGPAPERETPPPGPAGTLLLLSADSPAGVRDLAARVVRDLDTASPEAATALASGLASALARHRVRHAVRLGASGANPARLAAALREAVVRAGDSPAAGSPPEVVWVFPGQGPQWVGMGRGLWDEPVFRAALERCEEAMGPWVDWSLAEQLRLDADDPRWAMDRVDVIQPVLVSVYVALASLWESWGLRPAAVVGHSMGEVAAAHVAGILTLEAAMEVVCRRSALLRRIAGRGAMLVAELPVAEAEAVLAGHPGAGLAAWNGVRSVVFSGDPGAVDALRGALDADGVFVRTVAVDVASHSPQVDPLTPDLRTALASLAPAPGDVPLFSTVTCERVDGESLGADYWVGNLREPVRLAPTVQALARRARDRGGRALFLEVSPHPVLTHAVDETARAVDSAARAVGTLRRDGGGRPDMLDACGRLWEEGVELDWATVLPFEGPRGRLPLHPFSRTSVWYRRAADAESRADEEAAPRARLDGAGSPEARRRVIRATVRDRLSEVLHLDRSQIDGSQTFRSMGMDSLMSLELRSRLERDLGLELSATVVWNHPTPDGFAAHLASLHEARRPAPDAPVAPPTREESPESIEGLLDRELAELDDWLGGAE